MMEWLTLKWSDNQTPPPSGNASATTHKTSTVDITSSPCSIWLVTWSFGVDYSHMETGPYKSNLQSKENQPQTVTPPPPKAVVPKMWLSWNEVFRWRQTLARPSVGRSKKRLSSRVNNSIIVWLMQRFRQTGNVTDCPRAGRPRKTTPREDRFISRRARQRPLRTPGALRGNLAFAGHISNDNVTSQIEHGDNVMSTVDFLWVVALAFPNGLCANVACKC
jgi:hypothetical protein